MTAVSAYPRVRVALRVQQAPDAEESSSGLTAAAAAALGAARADVAALREERAVLFQQSTRSESSRALAQLSAVLSAERGTRFEAELRLRGELAALQAERDTLAARVATLERERVQMAELARRGTAPKLSSTTTSSSWAFLAPWAPSVTHQEEESVAAVQRHLVTVTTDRDLLAADLFRCMLERNAASRDRDCALEKLRGLLAPGGADA